MDRIPNHKIPRIFSVSFYNLKVLSAVCTFLPMDNILFFSTNYFPETIVSEDRLIKQYV
jgi:hypothetical protein